MIYGARCSSNIMPKSISIEKSAWVTCSPKNLCGCDVYANRDAGLVARGFRENGWPCRSIVLGPPREDDLPEIIRATRQEMENPSWWSGVAEYGVIFYNSVRLATAPVIRAAKSSGLPIAMNVDDTGIFDFHSQPGDFWKKSLMHKSTKPLPTRLYKSLAAVGKSYLHTFNGAHRRLAAHLAIADVIGGVTPDAVLRIRRFLDAYGQPRAADRVSLIPHPTHPRFRLRGSKNGAEEITFVTIGRWDAFAQKRQDLLMEVVETVMENDSRCRFEIFGKVTPEMDRWHSGLATVAANRVALHGIVPNAQLLEAFQAAHVYLCVSAYESFLIAAAEALCCGCSMVACDSPTLPGPRWFADQARGTLSRGFNREDLGAAAIAEANAWRQGARHAQEISEWAQGVLHADCVAGKYKAMLEASTGVGS